MVNTVYELPLRPVRLDRDHGQVHPHREAPVFRPNRTIVLCPTTLFTDEVVSVVLELIVDRVGRVLLIRVYDELAEARACNIIPELRVVREVADDEPVPRLDEL